MKSYKLFTTFALCGFALSAQPISGRYIVEMTDAPASALQAALMKRQPGQRTRAVSQSPAILARRAVIAAAQQRMAQTIQARGGRVVGSVDTALNALFVQMDEAAAEILRRLPGVLRVSNDRVFRAKLDRVLALSKVPESWARLNGGADGAGSGIRIAILDSGIDTGHPGFNDANFTAPEGFPKVSGANNEKYATDKVTSVRLKVE
jgi:subtilisin family serine protease